MSIIIKQMFIKYLRPIMCNSSTLVKWHHVGQCWERNVVFLGGRGVTFTKGKTNCLFVTCCLWLTVCDLLFVSSCLCLTVCDLLYVSYCLCLTVCVLLFYCLCLTVCVCTVCDLLFVFYCLCLTVCVLLFVTYCLCLTVCDLLYVSCCLCLTVCDLLFVSYCLWLAVCVLLFVTYCLSLTVCDLKFQFPETFGIILETSRCLVHILCSVLVHEQVIYTQGSNKQWTKFHEIRIFIVHTNTNPNRLVR